MEQKELFPLPNPCIGICKANDKGYCQGCLRSRKERQMWFQLNNSQKRYILNLCDARQHRLTPLGKPQSDENAPPNQTNFEF